MSYYRVYENTYTLLFNISFIVAISVITVPIR